MDAYLVYGQDMERFLTDQEHNLNVSHFTTLDSMDSKQIEG